MNVLAIFSWSIREVQIFFPRRLADGTFVLYGKELGHGIWKGVTWIDIPSEDLDGSRRVIAMASIPLTFFWQIRRCGWGVMKECGGVCGCKSLCATVLKNLFASISLMLIFLNECFSRDSFFVWEIWDEFLTRG